MINLEKSIIYIYQGITNLKQIYDENLCYSVNEKLLELQDLLDNDEIPNSMYEDILLFHHNMKIEYDNITKNSKIK